MRCSRVTLSRGVCAVSTVHASIIPRVTLYESSHGTQRPSALLPLIGYRVNGTDYASKHARRNGQRVQTLCGSRV
jgi:hypothetical protein